MLKMTTFVLVSSPYFLVGQAGGEEQLFCLPGLHEAHRGGHDTGLPGCKVYFFQTFICKNLQKKVFGFVR
jgi:hypothetical protein